MENRRDTPTEQVNNAPPGLIFVVDLDKLGAANFILDTHRLSIELRIKSRDPLIVSVARRLDAQTARREYWTPPPEWTDHVDALGRLLWHLNDPRKSKWRRAYGALLSRAPGGGCE